MPAEVGSNKEAGCGDIEEFVGVEQEKFKDFVKVKSAVGGNLYCAFYTLAEILRYLSIDSKSLLKSIEKHTQYKLSDHIESIKKAFDEYCEKSFYEDDAEEALEKTSINAEKKSAYAQEFKENGLCLDIFELDNIKVEFEKYLNNFNKTQEDEDWFDRLRRDRNKHLYHFIVGSYLATIYSQISLTGQKNEDGNNLEHQELIDLANHLFPNNPLCYLPRDREGFNSIIQQYTSKLTEEQLEQVISICTPDKFTEIESSYYHYGKQHFSALIPSQRFKQFNSEIPGLQIDGAAIPHQTPSSSPAPQNTEQQSKIEAEKINDKLLKDLNEAKQKANQGDEANAIEQAQHEFESPPIYSGLGLTAKLVVDPSVADSQEEFTYIYQITGCIEGGLASMFYNQYKDKDLHIVGLSQI